MVKSMYFPVRLKLTIWYTLLLITVIIIFGIIIYFSLQKMIIISGDLLLKTQANQIISSLDIENGKIKLEEEPFYTNSSLYGALYSYPDMALLESNLPIEILKAFKLERIEFIDKYRTIKTGHESWRVYSTRIRYNGRIIGIILLAQPLNLLNVTMKNLLLLYLILTPVIIIIAIVGGLFLASRSLKPVDWMTKVAYEISMGDLSRRLNIPYTNDEIGRLAHTFDTMIDKIDNSFKIQRRFIADASHELRTPIAIIQSYAESALNSFRSEDEYRNALTIILSEAKHMGKLVSDLLFLARSDSGNEKLHIEELNFGELVEGIVAELNPIAQENNINLKIIKNGNFIVQGDQTRLTQLLYNIIDNAIKYTLPGGEIRVSVEKEGNFVKTSVSDTGIGIPEEHLPHIFERFYRVDKARSREKGGTGLGLSICQWIARAHGGKIDVFSKIGKGSTFIIWLPCLS